MDWLGKMIGLPSVFLHSNEQTMGGGVIQVSPRTEAAAATAAAATTAAV